jgi:biotin synthase
MPLSNRPYFEIDANVRQAVEAALANERLERDQIHRLYAVKPYSPEAYLMQWAAHRVLREASDGRGIIYAQLGIDAQPCAGNCGFCSFAIDSTDAWREARILDLDAILEFCEAFDEGGAHLISIMTTASYDFERYLKIIAAIRERINPAIMLLANIGDFDFVQAVALRQAGIDVVYHAVRVGEGKITALDPAQRFATLQAAKDAGLILMGGVEPIYADQDEDEVIDRMLEVASEKLICTGLGALRPVKGTPMADYRCLSAPRFNVLANLFRLLVGTRTPFGGENSRWCDGGTNPRSNVMFPGKKTIATSIASLKADLESREWIVPDSYPKNSYRVTG